MNKEEKVLTQEIIEESTMKRIYHPDQRNDADIEDWIIIKMLRDVKGGNPYLSNEYFKKDNIYKCSNVQGTYCIIYGHGLYHCFKNEDIEIIKE